MIRQPPRAWATNKRVHGNNDNDEDGSLTHRAKSVRVIDLTLEISDVSSGEENEEVEEEVPYNDPPAALHSALEDADDASVGDDFGKEPYSLEELNEMFTKIEENIGVSMEQVEHGSLVTKSNNSMCKENTKYQDRAMYGRTKSALAEILFNKIFDLKYWHIFVDIGHGIGTLCLHASMTRGCESRGIEVCRDRNDCANVYLTEMERNHQTRTHERRWGEVKFRHGRLEDVEQLDFIIEGDKVFCNNFNDVFGCRSQHKVSYSPNTFIAGLFCRMKHKAELATLCQLDLPPSRKQVNALRAEHGLSQRDDASFFDVDIIPDEGGHDKLSFTLKPFTILKYTRITKEAHWYCWNPDCENSRKPIDAWKIVDISKSNEQEVLRTVPVTDCDKCNARGRSSRERKKTAKYGCHEDSDDVDDNIGC